MILSFYAFAVDCNSPMSDDIAECSYSVFKKSDDELNKIYQSIIQNLKNKVANSKSKDEKELYEEMIIDLRNSQRDWVKYRDSECNRKTGVSLPNSGRDIHLTYIYCPANLTEERIKALTVKCDEHEIGCIDY